MTSLLFPDRLHFHKRNFESLLSFIDKYQIPHVFQDQYEHLKSKYGKYEPGDLPFNQEVEKQLLALTKEELFSYQYSYSHCPIPVFPLIRSEMLTYLLAQKDNWINTPISSDDTFIFSKAFDENKDILIENIKAGIFWLSFYQRFLQTNGPFTHAFLFNGGLTYAKTLNYLLMRSPTKVLCVEHFFTGTDYYCEEKYTSLSNQSDLRFPNYYNSIALTQNVFKLEQQKKSVRKKIIELKNKNVTQPTDCPDTNFANENPTLLIIGQVQNDFSLIETPLPNINAISFYRELIQELLIHTNLNIIFKGHPWEHKKIHMQRPFSKEAILELKSSLPPEQQQRLLYVDHANIKMLFERCDYLALLNSQAGLEAAFHSGLAPIVFGDSFYQHAGLTRNFSSVEQFIEQWKAGHIEGRLSLEEFSHLETFLLKALQYHLVPCEFNEHSERMLKMRLHHHQAAPRIGLDLWRKRLQKLCKNPWALLKSSPHPLAIRVRRFLPRR